MEENDSPTEHGKALISLTEVHLTLESAAGPVAILRGVNFSAQAGEAIGIVGPSGSGKSTLISVIAGLERPNSGQVMVANHNLNTLGEDALALFRRKHIGIVFQSFHLVPTMTALDNITIPLELAKISQSVEKAQNVLALVGLEDRAHHYPVQLSGGEQQRVAIARAFITQPAIILADEPTGNLDSETGSSIIDILFTMRKQNNTTLILITHDTGLAAKCDRIISMHDGLLDFGQ